MVRTTSDTRLPDTLVEHPLIAQALAAAYWGEYETALSAVSRYLSDNPPETNAIFAIRETLAWNAQLNELDRVVADAGVCVERAVALWGETDQRTMIMRNSQMYWTGKSGLQRRAEALADALLADADMTLDRQSMLSKAIRNNVARIVEQGEQSERAEDLYRGLLDDFAASGEDSSSECFTTRDNYAQYLSERGRVSEAVELLRHQIILFTQAFGEYSPITLRGRFDVSLLTLESGSPSEAREQLSQLSADCLAHVDSSDPLLGYVFGTLLTCAVEEGNPQEIVDIVTQMLESVALFDEVPHVGAELMKIRNRYQEQC